MLRLISVDNNCSELNVSVKTKISANFATAFLTVSVYVIPVS